MEQCRWRIVLWGHVGAVRSLSPKIMDGFEESLKYLILNDRRAERHRSMGVLGVRVQKPAYLKHSANQPKG